MANKDKKAMRKRGERPARNERDDEVVGRPVGEVDGEDTEREPERPRRTRKKS